jgi:hypothetical protein
VQRQRFVTTYWGDALPALADRESPHSLVVLLLWEQWHCLKTTLLKETVPPPRIVFRNTSNSRRARTRLAGAQEPKIKTKQNKTTCQRNGETENEHATDQMLF